ncbi:hypothetical protein EIKCOROL_00498 [Eikenella corrodens ATCC 23834]|uniref:Uncharacterized protein n=1 Tax=Eikenella corrodens ATCC 23834 TaxID=546274 RepID=C0DT24_EIKCO|nr:hypothetical protein EIKCOROL_00498 [Eikenella corrodens ATCC 23834]
MQIAFSCSLKHRLPENVWRAFVLLLLKYCPDAVRVDFYSGLTKIRTRRRAADSTHSTARRANAVLV